MRLVRVIVVEYIRVSYRQLHLTDGGDLVVALEPVLDVDLERPFSYRCTAARCWSRPC